MSLQDSGGLSSEWYVGYLLTSGVSLLSLWHPPVYCFQEKSASSTLKTEVLVFLRLLLVTSESGDSYKSHLDTLLKPVFQCVNDRSESPPLVTAYPTPMHATTLYAVSHPSQTSPAICTAALTVCILSAMPDPLVTSTSKSTAADFHHPPSHPAPTHSPIPLPVQITPGHGHSSSLLMC